MLLFLYQIKAALVSIRETSQTVCFSHHEYVTLRACGLER